MKTMTCKQLGGACDLEFSASSFQEMAELSKQHGMEMYAQKDQAHLNAMSQMQEMMKDPNMMKMATDMIQNMGGANAGKPGQPNPTEQM